MQLIPLHLYTPLYFHIVLLFVLIALYHSHNARLGASHNIAFYRLWGAIVIIFVTLYMGLRPISGRYFGDMRTYYEMFKDYRLGAKLQTEKDVLFQAFIYLSSKVYSADVFFFICAAIYVIPTFFACEKWFGIYWFYPFLAIVGSFSFWAYGTNGIRNGIATSVFIYGLSRDHRIWQLLWLGLSVGIHKAMAIPFCGFLLTMVTNNSRYFYYIWCLSIPLSLALPGFWQNLFSTLMSGDGDNRAAQYLTGEFEGQKFSRTGFRWDFLIYSAIGVFAGWYYLFRKRIRDENYRRFYNVFLFANAFWILVIRANFSNRFAYLSWFLLALVVFYPLLRQLIVKEQHKKIGLILFGYYMFTYSMNVILK